ncbi:MAG: choice-of-anchor D domain-containing protein, partial [Crocinitomicaceae bacterium]|nr:choice-of-anchor D domain-containing protein [Crocinitomicaceae bacterium]
MKLSKNSFWVKSLALILMSFSALNSSAQTPIIRCHSVYVDSLRHVENPNLQTNEEFEAWIDKEVTQKKKLAESALIINGVYQIPVIVHIIHNGEAIGTGTNLSAAVIQSQIQVLNEDFRRILGTNGYNTNPVGADTEIEFCLAQRKPDGTGFTAGEEGINRVNRNTVGWGGPPYGTGFIDGTIKPYNIATQGYDATVYMNLWSVDISGGILGYAQFPTTVLGGMGCGAQDVNTDGVVMDYTTLGTSAVSGFPGPYNEGRTATHEIGHWLGLRHIWGDGGCGVDDYCNDTPLSDAANFGCPTTNSCADPAPDPNDQVENYMDYTDDLCMNIFTNDQKIRMRTVLETSPIRASLITSDACIPPATNDASIVNVLNPLGDNCVGPITPSVTLRNRGSLNLTSATIEFTIDGGTPTSFAWTGTIAPGNEANVSLPPFTATLGIHLFRAYSLLPNTVTDPDPTFDTTTIQFAVSNGYQPDHIEDFEAGVFPPDVKWTVVNPNSDCIAWVGQSCVSSAGASINSAALMTNYENNTNQDEYLYTPIFILPCNATSADLTFDYAYKKRVNGSDDRLRVQISEDCGGTWTTVLFDQSGNGLVTSAGNSNSFWIPGAAGDWGNTVEDLMPFVTGTSKNVQFRFRATNDGDGGNLYVDNVEFNAVTPGEIEVTATGQNVLDGGYYDFGSQPIGGPTTVVFTIDNPGTSNLILTGPITIVGDAEFTLNTTFGTTTVPAGGSTTFSVDFTPLGAGPYSAVLSFGTNDCDEAAYDFELIGTGNVTPPTASFTYSPAVICAGNTVTYTDASTGATGWIWTFPNGTPSFATGVGPHVITYNVVGGPYNAQLDIVNGFGSDTDLQAGIITVLSATGTVLPIAEGFVGPAFPPVGWLVVNGGIADTWVRDAANGNAPTAGNSAVMDNFTNNTSGNEDDLVMIPADFTGLVSAQLQFDVAYARYNATYQDQLQVLVSNDCGATYTVVYDKANTVLATDPDQTTAYTPGTWRQETVDLSAYVGSGKVELMFKNIGGWGQFLYIDNINLTGVLSACDDPDIPTMTYSPATVCDGSNATLTITGNLDDATDWYVYTGSCGGTVVGTTNTSTIVVTPTGPSTTYFIRGEGGCVIPGACGNVNVVVDPIEDATFSYGAAAYCVDASDPTPSISGVGSGSFTSSPGGLYINGSSGVIDVSVSTPNTYTITYTTPGACTGVSNQVVTINALPSTPTILASGPTTFCAGGSVNLTSSQASGNVWATTETTQTI